MTALQTLCQSDPGRAAELLALGSRQREWLSINAEIDTAPAAPAVEIYTGVLFGALDVASLGPGARRRAVQQIWVASALFGLVRFDEHIPAYRLSGSARLPGVPPPARLWHQPISAVVRDASPPLIVDLRSGAYATLWHPEADLSQRYVVVKVWQLGPRGQRTAVSHHNKASKGLLARELVSLPKAPKTMRGLVSAANRAGSLHGWRAEAANGQLNLLLDP